MFRRLSITIRLISLLLLVTSFVSLSVTDVYAADTATVSPTNSAHDAYQDSAGGVTINGTTIQVRSHAFSGSWGGVVFPVGDTITAGSSIVYCYLRLYAPSATYDDLYHRIHFEDVASPANYQVAASDISGRTLTTAYVEVDAEGTGVGYWQSPNLSAVLQEVVDSYDVSTVNAILKPTTDVDKSFRFNAFDAGTNVPVLYVEWIPFGTADPPYVSTGDVTNIADHTVTLEGTVVHTGNANVTSFTVQLGTSPGVYTRTITVSGSYPIGDYTQDITGLYSSTRYYWRARFTNSEGIGSGTESSFITTPVTYINLQVVSASSDDAYQRMDTGAIYNGLAATYEDWITTVGGAGVTTVGGIRWPLGAAISQSSHIINAYARVNIYTDVVPDEDNPNQTIYLEDAASPATFQNVNWDVSGRTRTTANITWVGTNIGIGWYDLSLITQLQEVVDSYSPDAICLLAYPINDANKIAAIYTYDTDAGVGAYAPRLYVAYGPYPTAPPSAPSTPSTVTTFTIQTVVVFGWLAVCVVLVWATAETLGGVAAVILAAIMVLLSSVGVQIILAAL